MKHPFVTKMAAVAAATLALAFSLPAAAERADRDKPMNAEADALRYDDLKQTSVFTGNVVITKGTTIIRGERVDVRQDPQGYQQATVTAAPGKLAYYKSKRDGVDEFIEGEGEVIEYDSRPDVVKFIRKAVLRRYAGATLADETTGALITYDNISDVFTVDGGVLNRSPANPSGRIRAQLSPRAAPGVAPAPAPSGPSPVLRPSGTLGNEKN
ncbi:MAG: lipopolysaccharide transport periplasmic protein LptA [Comamonadaceae bacterium]|nr:MAG: lipopolysaccharide transport periplasmic protein LptA [Comamonadaceae bacterium]